MIELRGDLATLLRPAVLIAFVALYVLGLASGSEPESALLRAILAGLVLAVLGRVALAILERAPEPSEPRTGQLLDVSIADETPAVDGQPGTALAPRTEQRVVKE
jgi:hypothetical protein